jgi:GT2 family glycosyltransferase
MNEGIGESGSLTSDEKETTRSTIAIVIPTYGRGPSINQVLVGLVELERPPEELIVVDQRHPSLGWTPIDEGLLARLKQRGVDTEVVLSEEANLPLARNVGAERAHSDVVLFIDDDVILEAEIAAEHLSAYGDPQVRAVAGRVVAKVPWPQTPVEDGKYVPYGIGCNISFDRRFLRGIGGFDATFAPSSRGEEVDTCIRLRRAGGLVVYSEAAVLEHLEASTGGERARDADISYHESFVRNMTLLAVREHGWPGSLTLVKHAGWLGGGRDRARAAVQGWRRGLADWRRSVTADESA